jgi:hypothetical protein
MKFFFNLSGSTSFVLTASFASLKCLHTRRPLTRPERTRSITIKPLTLVATLGLGVLLPPRVFALILLFLEFLLLSDLSLFLAYRRRQRQKRRSNSRHERAATTTHTGTSRCTCTSPYLSTREQTLTKETSSEEAGELRWPRRMFRRPRWAWQRLGVEPVLKQSKSQVNLGRAYSSQ